MFLYVANAIFPNGCGCLLMKCTNPVKYRVKLIFILNELMYNKYCKFKNRMRKTLFAPIYWSIGFELAW